MTKNHDSLMLNIGGISVLIYSESHEFIAQTKERYANFIVSGLAPSLQLEVDILPVQNLKTNYDQTPDSPDVRREGSKSRWTIKWQ